MAEQYDVLISGAGPVGLLFAYQFATLGHSFYICDQKEGPIIQSRAVLMTSRTLEVLENRGIAHHFLKECVVSQGGEIYFDGQKVGSIDAVNEGTSFPQLTLLAQDKAETILANLLHSKGATIHWNTKFKSYKQFDDHIEAVVEQGGEEKVIKAKYLVGADGAHSMVRKATPDWKYEGHALATKFAIADVVLEGDDAHKLRNQRMNMFNSGKYGFCLVIPLGRHTPDGLYRHRIVVNLGPYEEDKENSREDGGDNQKVTHGLTSATSLSIEQMQELLDTRLAPLKVKVRESIWTSMFRINERMVDNYRRKRAFLVGDAAHCHSPAGGQGLNLGYQDADNLAWKLSLVLNGASSDPEKLLDSYSIERVPVAKVTLQTAGGLTRVMVNSNWIMSYIIRTAMGAVLSFDAVKQNAVTRLMQLSLHIEPTSPILLQNPTSPLVKAGEYMPDTNVLRRRIMLDSIERQTIRQILRGSGARHTIIWLCSRASKYPPCPWTEIFWEKLAKLNYSDKAVRPLVVESTWHVHEYRIPEYATSTNDDVEDAFWMEDHPDSPESLTKRVGFNDNQGKAAAIIIVRPDLYIAHTAVIHSPDDIDPALSSLSSYLKMF